MTHIAEEKLKEVRQKLSIELCDNFICRLNLAQEKETKVGAIIAIRNLVKESQINDPIIFSFLVDTIVDPDKEVRSMVIKVIQEIVNSETIELLQIKLQEANDEVKKEINDLLNLFKRKNRI